MHEPEFYVGYLTHAPPRLSRFLRRAVAAIAAAAAAGAVLLALGQAPFAGSTFEYGQVRAYEGLMMDWPYPMLITPAGRYLLVAPGKHGLHVPELDGQQVRLQGTLIRRGEDRMLEVLPETLEPLAGRALGAEPAWTDLGDVVLTGEVVDSKCFLGAMNPGQGKVHRDCAVRCISGGVPPAFLVRDAGGAARVLLLTGRDGRRLGREILDFVAEPLTIPGRLKKQGTALVLQADPSDFRRE
ncbi:hypothetical protein [Paludibaculum fermentans]|uniref:hypothetical protein n=1 Tax=Paludibaculum fermentans TaxID=1473598 RepID=UPI003EB96807